MAAGNGSQEKHQNAMVEAHKMEFEVHRTQATIGGGAVLAIIAITELMTTPPLNHRWMLFVALILVVFSTGYALATMLSLATAVMTTLHPQAHTLDDGWLRKQKRTLTRSRRLSMLAFTVGLGISAWFLALNLFW